MTKGRKRKSAVTAGAETAGLVDWFTWETDAPRILIAGIQVIRCLIQPSPEDLEEPDQVNFDLGATFVDESPTVRFVVAECRVVSKGYVCLGTVMAHLVGREPSDLDVDEQEFLRLYAAWASHSMWDCFTNQARQLSAAVAVDMNIPRVTPKPSGYPF